MRASSSELTANAAITRSLGGGRLDLADVTYLVPVAIVLGFLSVASSKQYLGLASVCTMATTSMQSRSASATLLHNALRSPSIRTALLVHAAASYSFASGALRSKAFGTLLSLLDGSWRYRSSRPGASGSAEGRRRRARGIGRTRDDEPNGVDLVEWLWSGSKNTRAEREEGILGAVDMTIAYLILRSLTQTSLLSLLVYPLFTVPLPLALPHFVSRAAAAALVGSPASSPGASGAASAVALFLQAVPTAALHELEHLLALVCLGSPRRRRREDVGTPKQGVHAVRARGRGVVSTANNTEAEGEEEECCCICFASSDPSSSPSGESDDPLEAFCLSTDPPSRHRAHRSCLLTWYETSRLRSHPASLPTATATASPSNGDPFLFDLSQNRFIRPSFHSFGSGGIALWGQIAFGSPGARIVTRGAGPASWDAPMEDEVGWRAMMADAAQGAEAWEGGGSSSSEAEDDGEGSDAEGRRSGRQERPTQRLGGPWGLGRLDSTTTSFVPTPTPPVSSRLRAFLARPSPPTPVRPGVHLSLDPSFVRARHEASKLFWWPLDPAREDVEGALLQGKSSRVVGEVRSAGEGAPTCPVCRSGISILLELVRPPRSPAPVPSRRSALVNSPRSWFASVRAFGRLCAKIWRRRMGPASLANKVLLHAFMRLLVVAAVRGWTLVGPGAGAGERRGQISRAGKLRTIR